MNIADHRWSGKLDFVSFAAGDGQTALPELLPPLGFFFEPKKQRNLRARTVMNDNIHMPRAGLDFQFRMRRRLDHDEETRELWRGIRKAVLVTIPLWLLLAWALGFRPR